MRSLGVPVIFLWGLWEVEVERPTTVKQDKTRIIKSRNIIMHNLVYVSTHNVILH